MRKIVNIRKKIELLKLKKIAYLYLMEYEKPYYQNGANIKNVVHIQEPELEYDPVKNKSIRNYQDLITYQNDFYYFVSGSHTVTYMPGTFVYRKK